MGTQGQEAMVWDEIGGDDIGHNVKVSFFIRRNLITGLDERAGLLVYHLHADGAVCGGSVPFDVPANGPDYNDRPLWEVIHWSPLTLHPSILDPTCSEHFHGHIVAGHWVPC